jgi:predicted anti-sigma-YlaC factor YlaD
MVRCEEVIAELGNHLDDQTAARLRDEIQAHLSHCATCRVLFDSARKTLKIVTEARSFELPPELSERISRRIMEQIRLHASRRDPES